MAENDGDCRTRLERGGRRRVCFLSSLLFERRARAKHNERGVIPDSESIALLLRFVVLLVLRRVLFPFLFDKFAIKCIYTALLLRYQGQAVPHPDCFYDSLAVEQ